MGKIWLQTVSGKLIHLPVVGDDINSPDDIIKISTSIIVNQNRCYSNPIQINHPTYGNITIDLMQDSGLTGSCNQCGLCCGHPVVDCQWGTLEACGYVLHEDLNWHVCQYLIIDRWRKWGDPNNSSCSLYASILDSFKGCAYPPLHIKSWMVGYCGYEVI